MREFSIPALTEIPATANLAGVIFRRAAEQPQAVVLRRPGPSGASGRWQDVTASLFAGRGRRGGQGPGRGRDRGRRPGGVDVAHPL